MSPSNIETAPEAGFQSFDDWRSYGEELEESLKRGVEILDATEKGELTDAQKEQLPILVNDLRQLLEARLEANSRIAQIDTEDGTYNNAANDNKIRILLSTLRNLDIDMRYSFLTRSSRKFVAWFSEDLPNWFTVKIREVKDSLKHVAYTVAVPVALAGAATIAGYSIANGGFLAGMATLGSHISTAWKWMFK
jgi:hypothetical protein